MNIKTKIGLRIKELRKIKKLSQEKLGLEAGIDRTYVASVENGKRNISIENIEKLTLALGVSFEEFFKGIEQIEEE
jgi:transcriptional regulator with XRE-family HTH domain